MVTGAILGGDALFQFLKDDSKTQTLTLANNWNRLQNKNWHDIYNKQYTTAVYISNFIFPWVSYDYAKYITQHFHAIYRKFQDVAIHDFTGELHDIVGIGLYTSH